MVFLLCSHYIVIVFFLNKKKTIFPLILFFDFFFLVEDLVYDLISIWLFQFHNLYHEFDRLIRFSRVFFIFFILFFSSI
jgi:hypothetical protein